MVLANEPFNLVLVVGTTTSDSARVLVDRRIATLPTRVDVTLEEPAANAVGAVMPVQLGERASVLKLQQLKPSTHYRARFVLGGGLPGERFGSLCRSNVVQIQLETLRAHRRICQLFDSAVGSTSKQ